MYQYIKSFKFSNIRNTNKSCYKFNLRYNGYMTNIKFKNNKLNQQNNKKMSKIYL